MKYISIFEEFKKDEIQYLYNWVKKHGNQRIHVYNDKLPTDYMTKYHKQIDFSIKPIGIWYGFGESWVNFCQVNLSDKFDKYTVAYSLDIDRLNMPLLKTSEKII